MALQKGTNCFVSILESDEYFENRLNSENWFANDGAVEQALVTATYLTVMNIAIHYKNILMNM